MTLLSKYNEVGQITTSSANSIRKIPKASRISTFFSSSNFLNQITFARTRTDDILYKKAQLPVADLSTMKRKIV